MKRYFAIKAMALAVTAASSAAWGQTQYTIKDIAPPVPVALQGNDGYGQTLESSGIVYANSAGVVIGDTTQYPQQSPYNGAGVANFYWYYNTASGAATATTIGLTGAQYQRSIDSNYLNMGSAVSYNNSRIYQNGYVVGFSARYDDSGTSTAGTSLGSDVWIFNATAGTTTEVPLPSSVPVPAAFTANASNIAYSYQPPTTTATGTYEAMGGNSNTEMAGANGSVAGTVTLYYNTGSAASPSWTSGGTDAFYYNGTSTTIIGLVDGNDLRTTGYTNGELFGRTNSIVRDNALGEVLGTASYYGGATTASATGTDIWVYNANGSGSTALIAPPATINGDVYTGGGSGTGQATPVYITDSGIVAGTWQQFATGDTARALVQSSDAYLYNSITNTWTGPLGLTGSAYTYYPGTATAKTGFGGSTIPNVTLNNFQGTTETGMTVGYTTRTNPGASGTGATAGTDAWVYYPTGNVPTGATAGVTQVGLTGGIYEANPGGTGITNNTRLTNIYTMTPGGAVVGYSNHYLSATSTTAEGTDVWYYDPAHGITTSTMIGLTGTNHEFTPSGGTTAYNYHSSSITALNNNGLVGGYTRRFLSGSTSTSNASGQDAWVYSAALKTTFSVDPNDTYGSGTGFASQIGYISDTGVAIGWDTNTQGTTNNPSTTQQPSAGASPGGSNGPYYYRMFEWYLSFDSSDGLYDTPTFSYLDTDVLPSSYTGWSELYSTVGYAPSISATGTIVGFGGLTADLPNLGGTAVGTTSSDVPFVLTPVGVPEPTTIALLTPAVMLLGRRRRAR